MQARLNREQITHLHQLCDSGKPNREVAAILGVAHQSVSYQRRKAGFGKYDAIKRGPKPKTAAELAKEARYAELAGKLRLGEFMRVTGLTHTSYYKYKKKASSENQ